MGVTKLVIASHNPGKLKEYKGLCEPYGVTVSSAGEWNLAEPEETGSTFQENALLKARYVAEHANTLSMGDDGGLVIPALDGHPGVQSARWAKEMGGFEKARLVLEDMLKDKSPAAYFQISLALYDPQTQQAQFFEGKCFGSLSFPARGEEGFGYDSIFMPQGYDQTFAQLGIEVKKKISHRAQAFSRLIKALFKAP